MTISTEKWRKAMYGWLLPIEYESVIYQMKVRN